MASQKSNFHSLSTPENVKSAPTDDPSWIRCDGYFSDIIHSKETWLGWENGKIAEIRHQPPENTHNQDSKEKCYIVPLLSDSHVHYYMEPWPLEPAKRSLPGSKDFEAEVEDAIKRVKNALKNGLGLVRDMGDPLGINLEVKKRLMGTNQPIPELLTPGPGIHRPKKYGRYLGIMKDTVDEIKAAIVDLIQEKHVDYIKLVTTGIVNFEQKIVKQAPQFTTEELSEVVDFAHKYQKKVAAHCSGKEGLEIAIEAGVDFIEHAYFITDEQLQRLIKKQLFWTPTFAPVFTQGYYDECGWDNTVRQNIDEIIKTHNQMIAKAMEMGGRILAGTDAGCPGVEIGKGIRTELSCLVNSGISPENLLKMATSNNAQAVGAQEYTGKLEISHPASFGVYSKPPWENIDNLNSLAQVYFRGFNVNTD